jgi:hypothetical protein
MTSQETPCYVWDFRYSKSCFNNENELKDLLVGKVKKYVFQEECGSTGYEHYQGRFSLIKKSRKLAILKLFSENPPQYLQPTVTEEHQKEAFYCMKEETRVKGPWTDKDPPPPKLTKQMKYFISWGLRPWQATLKDSLDFDMRAIDLVYDPNGNIGKSLFSEYLEYIGVAEEIPPFRLMDDIFAWVASRPIKPLYIVDMPRGMKKDKLGDFYSGIEVIKNGVAFDKRYTAKKERFDRPRIIVFTNTLPVFKLMSMDRWKVWTIKDDQLIDYTEKDEDTETDED